jgi:hypothetical protein
MRARLTILLSLVSVISLSAGAAAETVAKPSVGDLSKPHDAGIRYGQAAGMAAVCLDMKPTQKAEALATSFTGSDLEKFKVQAETVLQSWKKTLTCAHKADPNPCRLAHQMSCMEGYKEIGPGGTVAPGLVEMTKAQ